MAYVKNIWVDQDVERPKTYEVTNNQDGSITLTDSFGLVTELGTPVNEVNMNHIEDGIDGCAIRKHNLTETFNLGEWVLGGIGDDEGIYKSLVASNVGNAISDDTKWEKVEMGGNSRNIGEIVASTIPLTDAGLHLLDGALLQYGSYQAFIDYIADLYDSGDYDDIFDTEANWQTAVATYGVCGKFVYDSVNDTVRLPKITGFIEGTDTASNLGSLVEAGLPNITGSTLFGVSSALFPSTATITGAFYNGLTRSGVPASQGSDAGKNLSFDASLSNSIYGNSNTVQPQAIKVLYYVVVATSTKTAIQVDIDEIATDLNGKMDKDGSNAVSSVKFSDGQWVNSSLLVFDVTSKGTYTADLSNYLPNDNYKYEIYLFCSVLTQSVYSTEIALNNEYFMESDAYASSNKEVKSSTGSVIIDNNRTLTMTITQSTDNPNSVIVRLIRYRRIGTNQ